MDGKPLRKLRGIRDFSLTEAAALCDKAGIALDEATGRI